MRPSPQSGLCACCKPASTARKAAWAAPAQQGGRGECKCNGQGDVLSPVFIVQATAEEVHRIYITNRDIDPGCVIAMPCCKAPR